MIDVTFSIISGTKHTLRLRDTTTVGEAKQTLSMITDSPPHTLTLLHKAKTLNDNDKLCDLDFASRNFIAVGIRRKSIMLQKHTGNIENNEDETSPLKAIFGDSFATVRRHFLENPASVPILIAYIARSDPANARLLTESPQILLRFLGISPEEFIVAINNMTQRFQQDQNQSNRPDLNTVLPNASQQQNQDSQAQDTIPTNQVEQNSQQSSDTQVQTQNDHQETKEDMRAHNQAQSLHNGYNQTESSPNSLQDSFTHHAQTDLRNEVTQNLSENTNNDNNNNSSKENYNNPATRSNDIDIASFLETMTSEDLSNLEIVLSTNVSLEEAIPVFLRTGKNVDATINALRRTRST